MNVPFKFKAILFILLGVVVGLALFILGDTGDAPGLSFIGLIAAFLLIMRGIYHTKVIQIGYHIPIILLVFGAIGIIFPIMLLLDGEIEGFSPVIFIVNAVGVALIIVATIMMIKVRKKNRK